MLYGYKYPEDIIDVLKRNTLSFKASNTDVYFANTPCSFDIETSSFYEEIDSKRLEKRACMYVWAFDIFDVTIIGRTWDDFLEMIHEIEEFYQLNDKKRLIIYVHNLAYEMQFIRKYFKWKNVFSIRERKPIYATTTTGIEFRCSYLLTGYALEKVGEMLKNPIPKLVGKLDYELIRTPITELTEDEIQYLIHDVKIVSEHIRECIEKEGGICYIPYTKTGYVRRECRKRTVGGKYGVGYKMVMQELTIEPEEYLVAKRAFSGGFTHANFDYTGEVVKNVRSFDFSSSYPAVMVSELFPFSKGKLVKVTSQKQFEELCSKYLCIFNIKLKNVQSKVDADDYISRSKCSFIASHKIVVNGKERTVEDALINNGRIHYAKELTTTITNIDMQIIKQVYDFEIVGVSEFYYYIAKPLPSAFVNFIIEMYEKKTILKGVEGKEEEYLSAKENVNSLYGMSVTDIVRKLCGYDCDSNEWEDGKETKEEFSKRLEEQLEKENNRKNRFLFYLWGVFVTAYARRNLWRGILECGNDYVYSDTDSIKIINYENHLDFIKSYNEEITRKIHKMLIYHKIDPSRAAPKTSEGITKPLGIWENDGDYKKFKTLGAKRYFYQSYDNKYHLTCAGLSKVQACKYIASKKNPFKFFSDTMEIPSDKTGKLTHTYKDEEFSMIVTDYKGVKCLVHELSYIHLAPSDYKLSLSEEYKKFLAGQHQINFT